MSQVHANQGLTADLLGPDVTEDNFAERMVALIAKRRREFAAQRFQDKRNKPMTYAQQKAYMRTFVKNQSSTIYIRMEHEAVKSFSIWDMSFKEVQINMKLQVCCSADSLTTSVEVPLQKSYNRGILNTKHVQLKFASDVESTSDDDTPVNFFAVVDWELFPTGLGWINVIYRKDNSRKCFTSLREILHLVTRADLMTIYGCVMTFYQDKQAAGVGLVLWGDLKVLMDSPEVNDVGGLVVHMLSIKKNPLSVKLIERMLDHQPEIYSRHSWVKGLTTAVHLSAFLKNKFLIPGVLSPLVFHLYFVKLVVHGF
ncbi:hypothetical protein Tco_1384039 [Tanacetum coccineum]